MGRTLSPSVAPRADSMLPCLLGDTGLGLSCWEETRNGRGPEERWAVWTLSTVEVKGRKTSAKCELGSFQLLSGSSRGLQLLHTCE